MNDKELLLKINQMSPWYQNIRFNENVTVKSSHSKYSGEWAWNYLETFLPKDMSGMRILDLGSNAGLFSIRCAQRGATVLGIENNSNHIRQANFLKHYFRVDNVEFKKTNLENISKMDIGNFDIILAIAVLYWVGRYRQPHYHIENRNREIQFIKHISTLSNQIIVRCRGKRYNSVEYYREIFQKEEFYIANIMKEREEKNLHEWIDFQK